MRVSIGFISLALLVGCNNDATPTFSLYRNSPFDPTMRIHWATFDAADKGAVVNEKPYNQGNCEMASEVLNANARRLNNGKLPARFWCEKGTYRP